MQDLRITIAAVLCALAIIGGLTAYNSIQEKRSSTRAEFIKVHNEVEDFYKKTALQLDNADSITKALNELFSSYLVEVNNTRQEMEELNKRREELIDIQKEKGAEIDAFLGFLSEEIEILKSSCKELEEKTNTWVFTRGEKRKMISEMKNREKKVKSVENRLHVLNRKRADNEKLIEEMNKYSNVFSGATADAEEVEGKIIELKKKRTAEEKFIEESRKKLNELLESIAGDMNKLN
jgi:chromosome segregation ATPase